MRILTCVVTHNRAAYTERTLDSLRRPRRLSDEIIVVDNASTDETMQILGRIHPKKRMIVSGSNKFPGAACNMGWTYGLGLLDADLLHRSDNDIEYLPGWQEEVEAAFRRNPELALLGVLNMHEDRGIPWPEGDAGDVELAGAVGGNVVMPRRLWDAGLRWSEAPWQPGNNEDANMSAAASQYGQVAMLVRTVAHNMAFCRYADYPAYYDETSRLRGIADAEHSV